MIKNILEELNKINKWLKDYKYQYYVFDFRKWNIVGENVEEITVQIKINDYIIYLDIFIGKENIEEVFCTVFDSDDKIDSYGETTEQVLKQLTELINKSI